VGQVEGQVEHAAARRRQVGLAEEDAEQEALCQRGRREAQQEEEDQQGVAVVQHTPSLEGVGGVDSSLVIVMCVCWHRAAHEF